MYIHGSFYNKQDEKVTVLIVTKDDRTTEKEIGKEEDGLFFSDDPVEITSQVNDTLDVLLCYQASIRLLCRDYVPDFFCNSCREAVVNILVDDKCYFAGFIEPQAFSQDYNEELDEIELTCIDCLSALQYSNYRNIGTAGTTYTGVKANADQRTFLDLIKEILGGVSQALCISEDKTCGIYVDKSITGCNNSSLNIWGVLRKINISELLFLGEEEDDVWTQEDVLTEILKYLNLHIVQEGTDFYIFNWDYYRRFKASFLYLYEISGISPKAFTYRKAIDTITNSLVSDCDTQLSITETYNQVLLTDNVTEVENVIESPLDSDSLIVAGNYQKYMTEYIMETKGSISATMRYVNFLLNDKPTREETTMVDWFCWPKAVKNWKFYGNGDHTTDIYSKYPADGTKQEDILNKGLTAGVGACVCAFGKIEKKNNDAQIVTTVSMDDYLVISTMGKDGTRPTDTTLLADCPVAEYVGNKSGGTFSPADEDTVNYIVISGKMALSPVMPHSGCYIEELKWAANLRDDNYIGIAPKTVTKRDGQQIFYTRKYWKATKWNDEPSADDETNALDYHNLFYPYTDTSQQSYEYKYSAVGAETDTIKKLGLVACMLIIGDKCVVEKQKGEDLGTGVPGTGEGECEDYVWMTYKERSECQSDDEYYQQSFTIGIDPKLGDKILGTEFDIQKNAPYTKGITAEGTAIPIKMGDHVSGKVQFKILGPVNAEWNNVTRRHPTFFRHTKWYQDSVLLLQKTNAIFMKDFKVEVVSDNGKMGAVSDESDIVYMSDTQEDFVNKKDDLEFKITTALTSEECKRMGVNNAVKLSSPLFDKSALVSIRSNSTGLTRIGKPEELYVDAVWREWHKPRIILEQGFLRGTDVKVFGRYTMPSLGKDFIVQGVDRNLADGTARVTLKEVS